MRKPIGALVKTDNGWIATQSIAKDLLTLEEIENTICKELELPANHMASRGGGFYVSDARNLYFYYADMLTSKTLLAIARFIHRDHTTARSGIRRIQDLIDTKDRCILSKIERVEPMLQRLQNKHFNKQRVVKMGDASAVVLKMPLQKAK